MGRSGCTRQVWVKVEAASLGSQPTRRFMSHRGRFWRQKSELQQTFAFLERSRRRDRRFKLVIFLATALTVVAIVTGSPRGRYAALSLWSSGLQAARRALAFQSPVPRLTASGRGTGSQGVTDITPRIDRGLR